MTAAFGAVVLLISMFLDWYSFNGSPATRYELGLTGKQPLTGSAWSVFSNTSLFLLVVALVALSLAVLTATDRRIDFPLAATAGGLGLLATLLIIDKLFIKRPGGNTYTKAAFGGYLGLVAVIVLTVGAAMTAREDGFRRRARASEAGDDPAAASASPTVAVEDSSPAQEPRSTGAD